MRDFSITAHGVGWLTGAYFWCYSLMQVPVGLLLDHLGTKRPLVIATLICAASTLLFANSQHASIAFLARGLMGAASAFAALSCLSMAAKHFPSDRFALLTGLTLTLGMLGSVLAEAPLEYLVSQTHWRLIMLIMGLLGLLIVILLYCFLPKDSANNTAIGRRVWQDTADALKTIAQNKKSWLISAYGMLMFTPFLILLQGSGINYLQLALTTSRSHASLILTTMLIGFAVGAPILGALSDHYHRRKPVLMISAMGLLLCTSLLIIALPHSTLACAALFFAIGVTCSGFLPGFSEMKEISPNRIRATALGFMNTLNMLGTALLAPVVGMLLDHLWQNQLSAQGTPVYTLHAYHLALATLPIMALLACLLLPWIPETYARCHD